MNLLLFLGSIWGWLPAPLPTIFTAFLCLLVIWVVIKIIYKVFELVLAIF